jgi:valyl-tRNA synthetase
LIDSTTRSLDAYDYAAALRETESFFWWFCDDYIELMKRRRGGSDGAAASAVQASRAALSAILRLFAPYLPFVTEEVWSWWQHGSIHTARWPSTAELAAHLDRAPAGDLDAVQHASDITARIRHLRSTQGLGFGTPVRARLTLAPECQSSWSDIRQDVLAGNNIVEAEVRFADTGLDASIEPVQPHA